MMQSTAPAAPLPGPCFGTTGGFRGGWPQSPDAM